MQALDGREVYGRLEKLKPSEDFVLELRDLRDTSTHEIPEVVWTFSLLQSTPPTSDSQGVVTRHEPD